jgi:hypothetical protein
MDIDMSLGLGGGFSSKDAESKEKPMGASPSKKRRADDREEGKRLSGVFREAPSQDQDADMLR